MDPFKSQSFKDSWRFKVLGNIMSKDFTAIVLKRVPEWVSNSVRKKMLKHKVCLIIPSFQELSPCKTYSPDRTLSINYSEKCLANLLSHLMICEFSSVSPSIMQHRIKSPGGSRTHWIFTLQPYDPLNWSRLLVVIF